MKKTLLLLCVALAGAPALYGQNTIGEVFSSDASVRGSVTLSGSGTHVLSGSQVSAGDGVALLKLERGGQVRICPKTNLSLSVDASGKSLVVGMNAGAMELDYLLQSSADSLITPDFRLQLISPGYFHLAISVAPSGDTCMRSLPGNDASVFIAEMMGNGAYQLSPGKNVLFKAGKISGATDAPPVCGCPKVNAESPAPLPEKEALTTPPVTAPPARTTAEPHLEVESSFVYRGNAAAQDLYALVARLSISSDNSKLALALLPKVSAPVAEIKPPEKNQGIFHRLSRFLGRLVGK